MEIEIRAKVNNLETIKQKVINLGGELIKKTKQIDEYFGEMNLYEKIGYSFLMRVREENDKKYITYKGAKKREDGVWEEYEFKIDDKEKAISMFFDMGLEKVIKVMKYREEYKLNNLSICLDKIENLGNFVEIESLNDNDEGKERLNKMMEELAIDQNQIIHKGYVTMLLLKSNSPFVKYIIN
jgi:adenylate cyclase class 2